MFFSCNSFCLCLQWTHGTVCLTTNYVRDVLTYPRFLSLTDALHGGKKSVDPGIDPSISAWSCIVQYQSMRTSADKPQILKSFRCMQSYPSRNRQRLFWTQVKWNLDGHLPLFDGLARWRRITVSSFWTVWESAHWRAPLASWLESTTTMILLDTLDSLCVELSSLLPGVSVLLKLEPVSFS